jgi:DnaJ-domain-containing protein 1
MQKNYYKVLQVDPSAEPEVIIAAYKRLALKYHPDRNQSPEAAQRMKEINIAYEVLCEAVKRGQYDKQMSSHSEQEERERRRKEERLGREEEEREARRQEELLKTQDLERKWQDEIAQIAESLRKKSEFGPGNWSFEPTGGELQMLQQVLGLHTRMILDVSANNTYQGKTEMSFMGINLPVTMEGQWAYDHNQRIIILQGFQMISTFGFSQTLPFFLQFKITGGDARRLLAIDSEKGLQWTIRRT